MNNNLYNTHRAIKDMVQRINSDYEFEGEKYIETDGQIWNISELQWEGVSDTMVPYIDAETLMSLIPALFKGIKNPKKDIVRSYSNYYQEVACVMNEDGYFNQTVAEDEIFADGKRQGEAESRPESLTTALSRRYFDCSDDGKNMWMLNPEKVLQDFAEEIKNHFKDIDFTDI